MNKTLLHINTIAALHRLTGLPKPVHSLISVFSCTEMIPIEENLKLHFVLNLYTIAILSNFEGRQFGYGPDYYHFDHGTLCFVAPGHLIKGLAHSNTGGRSVCFHPDLLSNSLLAKTIKEYEFFTYAVNEALHISSVEEQEIFSIMENIRTEYTTRQDSLTQSVVISQLNLLLNYCLRFYRRQYESGTKNRNNLIIRLEAHLEEFFNKENLAVTGIPSVQSIAEKLYVSPTYLSDVVRSITGMNTQQYIHSKVIEKAKILLGNSKLNISQVAYHLGFDYPQSFNKLFKKKMNMSPMTYRKSFA